jgi:hypothetical protein
MRIIEAINLEVDDERNSAHGDFVAIIILQFLRLC